MPCSAFLQRAAAAGCCCLDCFNTALLEALTALLLPLLSLLPRQEAAVPQRWLLLHLRCVSSSQGRLPEYPHTHQQGGRREVISTLPGVIYHIFIRYMHEKRYIGERYAI